MVNVQSVGVSKYYLFHFNGLIIGFEAPVMKKKEKMNKFVYVVQFLKKQPQIVSTVFRTIKHGSTRVLCIFSSHVDSMGVKIVLVLII